MVYNLSRKGILHLKRFVAMSQIFSLSSLLTLPFLKKCFTKFTVTEHVSSVSVNHTILEIHYLLRHNEIKKHTLKYFKSEFFEVHSLQMLDRISF